MRIPLNYASFSSSSSPVYRTHAHAQVDFSVLQHLGSETKRGGGKRRLDKRRPTSVELAGEEEEGEEGEFSKMTARWMLGNRPGQI